MERLERLETMGKMEVREMMHLYAEPYLLVHVRESRRILYHVINSSVGLKSERFYLIHDP